MKVNFIKKFQEGGAAPAAAEQPQGAQAGPEEQIAQMAQQIIQQIGAEGAAMLAETIMQMLQQGAQAQPAPQGAPVMARRGGRLVLVGRK